MKLQIGRRQIIIISLLCCCLIAAIFILARMKSQSESDPYEMMEKIENALGDDYQKQSMTELAATITYGNEDGSNKIYYRILKTTYYEQDPGEVTGLNTNALGVLFPVDYMDSCEEMKIQNWDGALYKKGESAYLCWTYSPEVSYVLEYNPELIEDSEIIKMAESASSQNNKV